MGCGRLSSDDWKVYTKTYTSKAKTVNDIYTRRGIKDEFDPRNIKFRESCDSPDNPNSTPLIVALDVTGSMSSVLDVMAREGLGTLSREIYDRRPISDPHIMYMGVGDVVAGDRAPLQCTQFEADIRIAEQLKDIWLEGHGGGNHFEGYNLPWYFAAFKTKIDSTKNRGKKGYLFTVGDEEVPQDLRVSDIERVFGDKLQAGISNDDLLEIVERSFHVYHIIVNQGSHYRRYPDRVDKCWRDLLGQNVFNLTNHTMLSELIVSIIQMNEGVDKDTIISSWDGTTSVVVKDALASCGDLVKAGSSTGEVVLF